MSLQAQIAAVAQGLADLRAEIEQPKKEEEKPVEAIEEDKPEEEIPEAPVEAEDKPEEEETPEAPVEETISEDVAPVEEPAPADEDADDETDDEDVKPGVAQQKALRKRVNAMQKKLAAMERQLASMAQDPSFAAAAMQPADVPCADAADGDGSEMSRDQANAAYAKLTTAKEKAEFRRAHAKELGL